MHYSKLIELAFLMKKQIQNIIKESHSEIVTLRETFVISKSGQRIEIEGFIKKLKPFESCNLYALEEYQFLKQNGNFNIIRRTS
jgi:hypothetical protein